MTRTLILDLSPLLVAFGLADQRSRVARGHRLRPLPGLGEARRGPNRGPTTAMVVGSTVGLLVAPEHPLTAAGLANLVIVLAVVAAIVAGGAAVHNRTRARR